jgi:hypothetical protein
VDAAIVGFHMQAYETYIF